MKKGTMTITKGMGKTKKTKYYSYNGKTIYNLNDKDITMVQIKIELLAEYLKLVFEENDDSDNVPSKFSRHIGVSLKDKE